MLEVISGLSIPVSRYGEEVGTIRFNPNDVAFSERAYALIGEMDIAEKEYTRKAGELEAENAKDENGIPANMRKRLALMREICEAMRRRIDEVFGEGTSQICFGDALDMDAIWDFVEGVSPYLDEAHQERIKKYTQRRGNRQQRRALEK